MRAGIIGQASAVGVVVLAIGFLAVGAVVEAFEGLVASTVLLGIGYAGKKQRENGVRSIKSKKWE